MFHATTINRKKSGEVYHAQQTITPMRDENGEVSHFVTVCRDMTDRRLREQQEVEINVAAAVQARLYPQGPPALPGIEVGAACQPATAACGDYYDFVESPDGSLCLVIGDICGHGLAPALIMVQTRAYLHLLLERELDLSAVMASLNTKLMADLDDEHFVTLLLARVHPRTMELHYVSAGHPEAFLLDSSGGLRRALPPTGMALGLSADAQYDSPDPVRLSPGDLLLMVTDGILESRAPNGRLYGAERLREAARAERGAPVARTIEALRRDLAEFVQGCPPEDDQTLVVCRVHGVDRNRCTTGEV